MTSGGEPTDAASDRGFAVRHARLVQGAVTAIDELGFENVTAGQIAEAAGVPRTSFYRVFANTRECLEAVLDLLTAEVQRELSELERDAEAPLLTASAVHTVLRTLDGDPALARVALVETASGGTALRKAREQAIDLVVDALGGVWNTGAVRASHSRLALRAAVAGLLWVAEVELAAGRAVSPFADEMTAMLCATARVPPVRLTGTSASPATKRASRARRAAAGKPPRLRLTSRTLSVLEHVAAEPGATNAMLAAACGNVDAGQMSKLLGRLERHGLIDNRGDAGHKWAMNVWTLTPLGAAFLGLPSRRAGSLGRGSRRTGTALDARTPAPAQRRTRSAVG